MVPAVGTASRSCIIKGVVVLVVLNVLSSCGSPPGPTPVLEPLSLSINNATTLSVVLRVNGISMGVFEPMTSADPISEQLPNPPWFVEAKTTSGRTLLTLDVKEGDVYSTPPDSNGISSQRGKAARADLSCGRLDIWAVHPAQGPAPPSSFAPGDCDP